MAAVLAAALIPTGAPAGGGVRHRVDIQRFMFVPEHLVVAAGDTVVWVNRDLVPHAVAAQDGGWGSSSLETNTTWELRVTEATSGAYVCPYHPTMRGQLHVRRKVDTRGGGPNRRNLEPNRMETAMTTRESVLSNSGASKLTAIGTAVRLEKVGHGIVRYGLVLVLLWIGAMKFTTYEATGIQPLVANSPVMSWLYQIFSARALSGLLGVAEIAIAVMIALRPVSAALAAVGSALAAGMFLVTLSFLLSTPGWEPTAGGFPALSVVPGQFLLKDVVLLGAAVWSLGEAVGHSSLPRRS